MQAIIARSATNRLDVLAFVSGATGTVVAAGPGVARLLRSGNVGKRARRRQESEDKAERVGWQTFFGEFCFH